MCAWGESMSGADLAEAANTSPATVSRTAQALGLRSFQHLRMLLVRDLAADATAAPDAPAGTEGFLRWLAEGRVGCCRPRSPRSTRSRSTPRAAPADLGHRRLARRRPGVGRRVRRQRPALRSAR